VHWLSDNFLRIARKEIQEELDVLKQILAHCSNDIDISNHAKNIERHVHKIKGLAPMMDQKDVGDIAKMVDVLLKHVIANGTLVGIHQILLESNLVMKEIFNGIVTNDAKEFKNKLQKTFSDILNQ